MHLFWKKVYLRLSLHLDTPYLKKKKIYNYIHTKSPSIFLINLKQCAFDPFASQTLEIFTLNNPHSTE